MRVLVSFALCAPACAACSASGNSREPGPDATATVDSSASGSDGALADAPDAGSADALGDSPGDESDDAHPPTVAALMTLYELATASSATLALSVAFHAALPHDYDDRRGGLGCTADHYDAVAKPVPADVNAGFLRVSGFAGGRTLGGALAANPIGCLVTGAYYACSYPAGESGFGAAFASDAAPLGPGPIAFAGNGGSGVGALYVAGSPVDGTLTVAEDLTTLRYDPAQDTVLHPTCSSACPTARIAVELTAFPSSAADAGWPYPGAGVVRCVFASAPTITVPRAAISAALASDTRLDSIETDVVRLTRAAFIGHDPRGASLTAEVGRGVLGTAMR